MASKIEKELPKQLFQLPPTTQVSKPCFVYNESISEVIVYRTPQQLSVFELSGNKKHDIHLPSSDTVLTLELSPSGVLAVLTSNSAMLLSPSSPNTAITIVDVEEGGILRWNAAGTIIAVGSTQGALLFYDLRSERKHIIVGKHSRRVLSLDWHNGRGWLLSCGEDRTIAISRENGDSVESVFSLSVGIDMACWAGDNWVGLSRDRRIVIIGEASAGVEPQLIALPAAMGRLLNVFWIDIRKILAVVAIKGAMAVVSMTEKNRGAVTLHESSLLPSIECCEVDHRSSELIVAGEGLARVLSLEGFDERFRQKFSFEKSVKPFSRVVKSGEVMLLLTTVGQLFCLLTHIDRSIRIVNHVALRVSLDEAIFRPCEGETWQRVRHKLGSISHLLLSRERLFLLNSAGFSEFELCCGTLIHEEPLEFGKLLGAEIDSISSCILLLFEGKAIVRQHNSLKLLAEVPSAPTYICLDDILGYIFTPFSASVYILSTGELCFKISWPFHAVTFAVNPRTAQLMYASAEGQAEYHSLQDQKCIPFTVPPQCRKLLLDSEETGLGAAVLNNFQVSTLLVRQADFQGSMRIEVAREPVQAEELATFIDSSWEVLSLKRAVLTCADSENNFHRRLLASHAYRTDLLDKEINAQQASTCLAQALDANDLWGAVRGASYLESRKEWRVIAERALQGSMTRIAVHCLQKDGCVLEAQLLKYAAAKGKDFSYAISALLTSQINVACEAFAAGGLAELGLLLVLREEGAQAALEMARKLSLEAQWAVMRIEVAEELLDSDEVIPAQKIYEEILTTDPDNNIAQLGRACCFVRRGVILRALEAADKLDIEGCAELAETAEEHACWVFAFKMHMRTNNWKSAGEAALKAAQGGDETCALQLLEERKGKEAESAFVKLGYFFEAQGRSDLAENFFQDAGNALELIHYFINRKDVKRAEETFTLLCPRSTVAASYLAETFSKTVGCEKKAIIYLVRAAKKTEAITTAIKADLLEAIAEDLFPVSTADALRVAQHFVQKKKFELAGKFYVSAAAFEKALEYFLRGKCFNAANQLVAQLENPELFEYLSTLYQGEVEGIDANLDHLFELHLLFKRYASANALALDNVGEELLAGRYKAAFHKAVDFCTALGSRASFELQQKWAILQLYALGRAATRTEDHYQASLLLNAVCGFIHLFPRHAASILTSAVVEATKAGHRHIAYTWAVRLCRPEQRETVDEKFKDRVEKIALKPTVQPPNWYGSINKELQGGFSFCLVCKGTVADPFALSCPHCATFFKRCMCSGYAILSKEKWDVIQCSACKNFAYWEHLAKSLQQRECCPVCEQTVQVKQLPTNWSGSELVASFLFKPFSLAEAERTETRRAI